MRWLGGQLELQGLQGELRTRKQRKAQLEAQLADLTSQRRILRAEDRNARDFVVKQLDFERDLIRREAEELKTERTFKQSRLEKTEQYKIPIETSLNMYRLEYLEITPHKEVEYLKRRLFQINKELEENSRKRALKEAVATIYVDLDGTRAKSTLEAQEVEL